MTVLVSVEEITKKAARVTEAQEVTEEAVEEVARVDEAQGAAEEVLEIRGGSMGG